MVFKGLAVDILNPFNLLGVALLSWLFGLGVALVLAPVGWLIDGKWGNIAAGTMGALLLLIT